MIGDGADKHAKALDGQRSAHGTLALDLKGHDAHHASLVERIEYLEKNLSDSADKHAREIEALKASHAKHLETFAKHTMEKGDDVLEEKIQQGQQKTLEIFLQDPSDGNAMPMEDDEVKSVKAFDLLMEERRRRHEFIKKTTKMWKVARAARQAEMDALQRRREEGLAEMTTLHASEIQRLTANFETELEEAREQSQLDHQAKIGCHITVRDDNNGLDYNNGLDDS
eukprot:4298230-Heterocapsa_arctica.AAC.1